ncbi:hypothetical protein KBC99_02275 [Candidatus Saccharibacteria bacterium]|nr:hypothetical protein [Candidatus Saccharibacteria bacterium]
MTDTKHHVIYLEHDAEITEAIEKLKKTDFKSVRIVVPTRSPLLQSIVNLKLLKKAATDSKKELILVTSDKHAAALAGKVGLLVAKNVKSEALLPASEPEPTRLKADSNPLTADIDEATKRRQEDLPIQRFDEPESKKSAKKGRGKIPNYTKFQVWIWAGAAILILLIVSWVLAAFLQTATVKVMASANPQSIQADFIVASSPTGDQVAAQSIETIKELSQSIQPTGQKDIGSKASGTVTVSNCSESEDFTIPAGTGVVTSSKQFVTGSAVLVPGAKFSGGSCSKAGTAQVAISASENGDNYNFSQATFAFSGLNKSVTATGTTSGGLSKKITVLSKNDVDTASKTLIDGVKGAVLIELKDKATSEQKILEESLASSIVSTDTTPAIDAEAASATIKLKVKYVITAISKTELEKVVARNLQAATDKGDAIIDSGLDTATIKIGKDVKAGKQYTLTTTAYTGAKIDTEKLKKDVAGKSKKEVSDIAKQYPSVTSASVDSWPFISNMPSSPANITVTVTVQK